MNEWTAISVNPILAGYPDRGFVPAMKAPHQDAGFFAVKRADTGKFRFVGEGGEIEDNRISAGAGERFIAGQGGTVLAHRGGKVFVFAVA